MGRINYFEHNYGGGVRLIILADLGKRRVIARLGGRLVGRKNDGRNVVSIAVGRLSGQEGGRLDRTQ